MGFFRKQTKWRSFAAICAAYAVILHAFFGGIVLSQNAAAAGFNFVICQGTGSTGANHGGGQTPSKHLDCILHCATHAAGTVPEALPETRAQFSLRAAPLIEAATEAPRSHERTPRLAQAPPANV
jgi:hypothetical protein